MFQVPLQAFFPLILVGIGCLADVGSNENKADFDEFLKKYNLTFDGAEYNKRSESSGNTAVGINRFAATDPEEFKAMLMPSETMAQHSGQNASGGIEEPVVARAKRQIPITSSLDYRTKGWVTPVRNQAQCRLLLGVRRDGRL
ncbi:hypothetical protein AAVH_17322 [Aphelenchoides avenae]|nr:hypothetical protein AAVH_17322 [Aphelenchus avenae]